MLGHERSLPAGKTTFSMKKRARSRFLQGGHSVPHGGGAHCRSLLGFHIAGFHIARDVSPSPDSLFVRPLDEERQHEGDEGGREEQEIELDVEEESSQIPESLYKTRWTGTASPTYHTGHGVPAEHMSMAPSMFSHICRSSATRRSSSSAMASQT